MRLDNRRTEEKNAIAVESMDISTKKCNVMRLANGDTHDQALNLWFIIENGSYSIVGIDQVSYGFRQKCALK